MKQETLDLIRDIELVVFGLILLVGTIAIGFAALSDPNKDEPKNKKAS